MCLCFYTFPKPSVCICICTICIYACLALNRSTVVVLTWMWSVSVCRTPLPVSRRRQPAWPPRSRLAEFTFATVAVYWFLWQSHRCLVKEDQPLHSKRARTAGALVLTGVFIYSLTGGLLLSSASEDRFHLFHLLRFVIATHLVSDLSWVM